MKKLLSMLGAITLIGTTSTNVVACGGEKPSPISDTKTDISNKITSPIALGQLDANTALDFLAKLQTALAKISDLSSIKTTDYDVFKSGTTTAIPDSDITAGNSLNIKIVAKGSKFEGTKDNIKVSYIQIDFTTMIKIRNLGKIIIQKDIPDKDELLKAIKDKNPSTTKFLTTDDFEFKEPITSNNATIIGKNKYKGEVILSFAINGIIIKFKNNYIFQYKRISVPIFVEKDLWPEVIKKSEFPSDLSKNIIDYNYKRLGDGIWVAIINSQITHKPSDFWFNVKNKYNNKIIKIYGFLQG